MLSMHPQVELGPCLMPNLKELQWPQNIPESAMSLLLGPSLKRVEVLSIMP
jgi:hypothetical protein